jgi:hypothetical protein
VSVRRLELGPLFDWHLFTVQKGRGKLHLEVFSKPSKTPTVHREGPIDRSSHSAHSVCEDRPEIDSFRTKT